MPKEVSHNGSSCCNESSRILYKRMNSQGFPNGSKIRDLINRRGVWILNGNIKYGMAFLAFLLRTPITHQIFVYKNVQTIYVTLHQFCLTI